MLPAQYEPAPALCLPARVFADMSGWVVFACSAAAVGQRACAAQVQAQRDTAGRLLQREWRQQQLRRPWPTAWAGQQHSALPAQLDPSFCCKHTHANWPLGSSLAGFFAPA